MTNNTCYLTYCFYITHSYISLECEDLRVGFGRLYLSRSQHVIMFQSNTREPRLLDWDSPSKIKASTPEQVRSSPSLHVSNHTQVVLVPPNSSLNLMEQVAQLHENHQACHWQPDIAKQLWERKEKRQKSDQKQTLWEPGGTHKKLLLLTSLNMSSTAFVMRINCIQVSFILTSTATSENNSVWLLNNRAN